MNLNLNPSAITSPPNLESERLLFKPVSNEFRHLIFRYLSDRQVRTNMKMPVLDTPETQEEWWVRFQEYRNKGEAAQWCAFFKESGEYAGLFTIKEINQRHFRGEIGYSVMQPFWGNGIGAEGAKRLMDYAYDEIGLHTLFAMILPYNTASQRIVKRLGFEQEGLFPEMHLYKGAFYDVLQFSKINPAHR